MAKQSLPVYSIHTLNDAPSPRYFIADHFAHYLHEHQNLQFPHKHSFYQLVYFSKGQGPHSIDFTTFNIQKGQLYFMIPGQVHSWDFTSTPDGFIVNFSDTYLQSFFTDPRYLDKFSFFSGKAMQQVINLPEKMQPLVEILLQKIVAETQKPAPFSEDYIKASLLQLFIEVSRYTGQEETIPSSHYNSILLRNFQQLIEQQFKQKRLTSEYAAQLYITPNHLNALCRDMLGTTAGDQIRNRVLLEAKRLLINADMTIAEIAAELSFADNSYFSKFFKKYEGSTPENFRKEIINK